MENEQIAKMLQHLIGTRYVPSLKAYIGELTGRTRVIAPDESTTKEFDPNRIHVRADQAGLITGFTFN